MASLETETEAEFCKHIYELLHEHLDVSDTKYTLINILQWHTGVTKHKFTAKLLIYHPRENLEFIFDIGCCFGGTYEFYMNKGKFVKFDENSILILNYFLDYFIRNKSSNSYYQENSYIKQINDIKRNGKLYISNIEEIIDSLTNITNNLCVEIPITKYLLDELRTHHDAIQDFEYVSDNIKKDDINIIRIDNSISKPFDWITTLKKYYKVKETMDFQLESLKYLVENIKERYLDKSNNKTICDLNYDLTDLLKLLSLINNTRSID